MTPGARRVLQELADDEHCDLVAEGIQVWCGQRQTTRRVLNQLLWCVAISISWSEGKATYYCINDTGRAILRRPELEDEIHRTLLSGNGAFTIRDDALVPLVD